MHDFLIIGSGFGGSVSALRLAEKGYSVTVLEQGRRWRPEDLPRSSWDARRFLWLPELLCHGIFNMSLLRDVFVLRGVGVGGGSLVYANTLLVPPPEAWRDPAWAHLANWGQELAPWYALAQRMLGVARNPRLVASDHLLRDYARALGKEHSFEPTDVGVFFGEPGQEVDDPYFDGQGPRRTGCTFCGGCMVGCRPGGKNTLDKNYLYLAERKGAQILPERRVLRIRQEDDGYVVTTERSTALFARDRQEHRARQVVLSAGVLGTLPLLLQARESGDLPGLSPRLGSRVRTNSEAILGVRTGAGGPDHSEGIAITSRIHLDPHTHMEPVRYPAGSDALSLLTTLLTDGGGSVPRPLRWIGQLLAHPIDALRNAWPFGWSRRTIILLVMQTLDSQMQLRWGRRWYWPFSKGLDSSSDQARPPSWIPAANQAARDLAQKTGGIAQSSLTEVLLDVPTTAHILGGCPMGKDADEGVIDDAGRVHGQPGLWVIDGSMIGANLGVNPSLTITALAERAMSRIPARPA